MNRNQLRYPRFKRQHLSLCLLFCCLSTCFAIPAPLQSAPLRQAEMSILQIHNQAEQTICYVVIANVAATTPNGFQQVEVNIATGETHSIELTPGHYHLGLIDCAGNVLLINRDVSVQQDHKLLLTQADLNRTACEVLKQGGHTAYEQSQYLEALTAFQSALACFRRVGDRAGEGGTLNNIGLVYNNQGRYEEALERYEQALVIRREVGDRTGEGATLNNIGSVYDSQGRYKEALERYEQALVIRREVADRPGEGRILNNIGLVYNNQGRYGEALERFEQALVIRREVGDRAGEGATLHNIGSVYNNQGRYEEALERFEQALVIWREVGNRTGEGTTLNNIGSVYDSQGRYDEALERYEQSLAIAQEVGNRAGEGTILNNIGGVYDNQGQYGKALEQYEQALAIRREVGDRSGEGTTLNNIGLMYNNQGRYEEALERIEDALTIFETVRAEAGSEAGRARFIDQYIGLYNRALSLARQIGAEEQAFLIAERGRARAFVDTLATGEVQLEDNATSALLTQERALYAERQALQDALARSRALVPPAPQEVAALEAELAAVEEAYANVQAEIAAHSDQLAALIPGRSTVLELAEVQALLDEETTLLSYWMLGEEGTVAFVVTADSFDVVELPQATPSAVLNALEGLYGWMNRELPHPRSLRQLHAWLVAPLAEYLRTPHVAIVPHQQIHYVPFTGLSDGDSYFGNQFTLSVFPSATTLQYLQENAQTAQAANHKKALIFGNPTTPLLPLLAHAADEAQAIGSLFSTTIYTSTAATEAELWRSAEGVGVLHLAAHGSYNETSPLHSAIYLAHDDEYADEYDGRLEVQEIFALPLQGTQLVTLSACETSIGELSRGDELVGLTRAFFFAGTPTVISSLWNVDDAATETLMVAFYTHWLDEGMSKAAALQAAQADVRADPRWTSPFYWAGFVLNGHPGYDNSSQGKAAQK